ncbi:DUF1501 domain-containing protein [Ruegeria aquimaris]|uniref:DUF1501 domain-containing protein n=1 Tax=Ruegeria aquimaris TaxID=2984333 RepID=A0ABT3AJ03_9RHOB|nr:DUF1501 domain-containing protein [Ruegeria sp. XHP0148]MCV2888633.1 DUF1501 domain-containing protein [Ruegeria sp. XHP0148]
MSDPIDRRHFLLRSGALGCCLAASPLITPVSLAAAPWDTRLVVIILRGGMDALDVLQPYGDRDYAGLRPTLTGGPETGAHDLDGFYALHPALAPLLPLWQRGELGFVNAVATPYRNKRSHFDGQDLLEAGTENLHDARDGWLNRALQNLGGVETRTAFAIGAGELRLLDGAAPVSDWSPDVRLAISPQARRLAEIVMEADPLFHASLAEALELSEALPSLTAAGPDDTEPAMQMLRVPKGQAHVRVADFAAQALRQDTRLVAFSMTGWDTHNRQSATLPRALDRLADTILALRTGTGPEVWGETVVMAMTEFGRTIRENGTAGTDHGTGGTMLLAGGALRGGRVLGRWPGLAEADLFDRRDLMPTSDVRAAAGWVLHGVTGLPRPVLEQLVFPGLEMGPNPGLLL